MNFALIIDNISNCESYYVKDGKAFNFNTHEPYSFECSIGSECFMNTWNYPFLYEGGYFINWNDFQNNLPNLELDVIFVTIEDF